jgi:hypothetical protein
MKSIPEGRTRNGALRRVARLDCRNPDKTLASCNPAAAPPHEVLDLQNKLAAASVDGAAYAKALATELQSVVCANDDNAVHVLRGLWRESIPEPSRLGATDREAPRLVNFIMSKDCPLAAALTEDDKANLLKIKQDAEEKFPSRPAFKKEN